MNRTLRKAIMKRSELERKYLKNRTNENRIRYKKQKKSFVVSYIRKNGKSII